jgi:hypothetical protein
VLGGAVRPGLPGMASLESERKPTVAPYLILFILPIHVDYLFNYIDGQDTQDDKSILPTCRQDLYRRLMELLRNPRLLCQVPECALYEGEQEAVLLETVIGQA